ncbi:deoxycytidylate deaminase [Spirobacillus cienkowskii]|jgi:dCMP deaminase|uniref:Cytidine deaminase n=1 Tax=Spirobacillus cienkowskii TaxID=495820 RepID=A0A369KU74_9BACT|nr:MAG: cytidine deaminase [Spirobacillus cienkowskii]
MSSNCKELKEARKMFPVISVNYANRAPINRPTWDQYFLEIAAAVAKRSHDGETQVGVVIADENKRIMATGYNGFPPGSDDLSLPNLRPDKYPFMVHAEVNAIAASRQDLRGSTLYCTFSPCRDCAKAIITAGIKNVVFKNSYNNDDYLFVMNFLNSCGVATKHVPD